MEQKIEQLETKINRLKDNMDKLRGEMVNLKAFIFIDGHDLELLYERAKKAYDKVKKDE